MIRFKDSIDCERYIEFSPSFNKRYVNLTIYVPSKSATGNTLQMPVVAFKELIKLMQELDKELENENTQRIT